jgi:hypothetical protein
MNPMTLNPLREALGQAGQTAFQNESPFRIQAESGLARFQAVRDDLERQVHRGDLTLKMARAKAGAAAAQLRSSLRAEAESFSLVSKIFLDRLIEVGNARKRVRENQSLETLQRETNRLLRQSLIEQQLQNRVGEFEGRAFVRPMHGGTPSPTLESLLTFHEMAQQSGDEAAQEWTRRQLEGFRGRLTEPEDQRRVDLACDRPDRVNPRLVSNYVEAMQDQSVEEIETFVNQALEEHDANACVAAFLMARQAPEGSRLRWVRMVLNGLGQFPDVALSALRTLEAEARQADAEAARAQADFVSAQAEALARFSGVEPPSETELERQARLQAKPAAQIGEPIGLALNRRGLSPEEFQGLALPESE